MKPEMIQDEQKIFVPEKVIKYDILKSPYYAIIGIITAFKREPNLSIQVCIGLFFVFVVLVSVPN